MGLTASRSMFVVALVLTGICAVSMMGLVVAAASAPSGMEALAVFFLGLVVGVLHVVLGLPALLIAFAARRHYKSWWIFAYFGLAVVGAVLAMQAIGAFDGPARAVEKKWWEVTHPADARLCRGLRSFAPTLELQRALEDGANAAVVCDGGGRWQTMTPLEIAASENRVDVADLLVSAGASAVVDDVSQWSLLVLALSGRYGITDEHARAQRRDQLTAIREMVAVLLAAGADVRAPDSGGITPLHWAVNLADIELVDIFLDAGADIEAIDQWDRTPTSVAVRWGGIDMLDVLLSRGAEPLAALEEVVTFGTPAMVTAVFEHTEVEVPPGAAFELLYQAARRNKPKVLDALVGGGIDLHATSDDGRPLIWPLAQSSNTDALKLLLDAGADPDRKWKGSENPLHFAARMGRVQTIGVLLDAGAEIDARASRQQTPLMLAAQKGRTDVVRELLSRGADPRLVDSSGNTAADIADNKGHSEVAFLLR